MKLAEIIGKIELNQELINQKGKFEEDILKKINYKFRLDWNYYSNRMEGGTLTREETRSVMVGNIDVQGKPLKDVIEMNGHDREVLDILKMGKGEQRISEKRIKEIHKAIMHEDDTEKKKQIGAWKTDENEIINYKGEKIRFTSPTEVPDAVHAVLNKTNAELDSFFGNKKSKHPLEIAAQFHIDFVTIHPFYDGNGRTTRILTNLILISCGFPPVIIKENKKNSYYQFLADVQVYGGSPDLFYVFIGERILESQQIVLDAIEGKSIEEDDDLDKEITLWKQSFKGENKTVEHRSVIAINKIYKESIKPLFQEYIEKFKKFDDLFLEKTIVNKIGNYSENTYYIEFFDSWIDYKTIENEIKNGLFEEELEQVSELSLHMSKENNRFLKITNENEFELEIQFKGFKNNGVDAFDHFIGFKVYFERYYYRIEKDKFKRENFSKKLYSEKLTNEEINEFVKEQLKVFFEELKSRVDNSIK